LSIPQEAINSNFPVTGAQSPCYSSSFAEKKTAFYKWHYPCQYNTHQIPKIAFDNQFRGSKPDTLSNLQLSKKNGRAH